MTLVIILFLDTPIILFIFWKRILTEPEAYQLCEPGWPKCQRSSYLCFPVSPPNTCLYTTLTKLPFSEGLVPVDTLNLLRLG